MLYLLYGIHVIVCIFLILVVLLQQGQGADLSVFGGGSTQTAFGARSATTLLHKLTVTSFVVFIFTTLLIGIMQGGSDRASLMSDVLGDQVKEGAATPDKPADDGAKADQPATDDGGAAANSAQPAGDDGTAAADQAGADQGGASPAAAGQDTMDQGATDQGAAGQNAAGGDGGGGR